MPDVIRSRSKTSPTEIQSVRQSRSWIRSGPYRVDELPGGETLISVLEGRVQGAWQSNQDSQSEGAAETVATGSERTWNDIRSNSLAVLELLRTQFADIAKAVLIENQYAKFKLIEGSVDPGFEEPIVDEISQWLPQRVASGILEADTANDMTRLRELIFIAEDKDFSRVASAELAPLLLGFAIKHRDSEDPTDETVVWSAIRTGASMLAPEDAERLLPLLEPGHSIETSLVALKMLGRIFEAQPPRDVDEHRELADIVLKIAQSLLNPYAVANSQSAAMAHLAIYALAAVGSQKVLGVLETVHQLNLTWFTRRTIRKLTSLQEVWADRPNPVSAGPRQLLDEALQALPID